MDVLCTGMNQLILMIRILKRYSVDSLIINGVYGVLGGR